jgi:hypothetical protein
MAAIPRRKRRGVDVLVRLIEAFVQWIVGLIEPLFFSGGFAYLLPLALLAGAGFYALFSANRLNLLGLALGLLAAFVFYTVYLETNGDAVLSRATGDVPHANYLTPGVVGLLLALLPLLPLSRRERAGPLMVAAASAGGLILLFLAWRAPLSVGELVSAGLEDLALFRQRYVGAGALGFTRGVLLVAVLGAAGRPGRGGG